MADSSDLLALQIANSLPEARRLEFQMAFTSTKKDRSTALLLSVFLGYLGVDRFYLGHTALGVGKLLTLGGCGIWQFVDWFLIGKATDNKNMASLRALQTVFATSPSPALPQGGGWQQGQAPQGYGPPPQQ